MEYKIHGSTIFIKGNGVIGHYKVNGNEVLKVVAHEQFGGDDTFEHFYTFGDIALNSEAVLLNELRQKGEI